MPKINLRDLYPGFYKTDCIIDVPDDVLDVFVENERKETSHIRQMYRYKEQCLLTYGNDTEKEFQFVSYSPNEIYERKLATQQLYTAVAALTNKQGKRIYAHYLLGISKTEIARAEGVWFVSIGTYAPNAIVSNPQLINIIIKVLAGELRAPFVVLERISSGLRCRGPPLFLILRIFKIFQIQKRRTSHMAKPKTRAEDIRNPEHYFNKYIALEVKHDQMKQREIEDNECSLEEKAEFTSFDHQISVNKNGELFDEVLSTHSELAWMETVKNPKLYAALQSLSDEQKRLLTLIYVHDLSQEQLAVMYGISQQAISRRIQRAQDKIKTFFERGL